MNDKREKIIFYFLILIMCMTLFIGLKNNTSLFDFKNTETEQQIKKYDHKN